MNHLLSILDRKECDSLDRSVLDECLRKYKTEKCEKSRERIFLSHLRLAYMQAVKSNKMWSGRYDLEDLFNECCISIHQSIEGFDIERGDASFTTYCRMSIKSSATRYCYKNLFIVHVPENAVIQMRKNYKKSLNKDVGDEEECDAKEPTFDDIKPVYLDSPGRSKKGDNDGSTFLEKLEQTTFSNPFSDLQSQEIIKFLRGTVELEVSVKKRVINDFITHSIRYGLDGDKKKNAFIDKIAKDNDLQRATVVNMIYFWKEELRKSKIAWGYLKEIIEH